MNICFQTPFLSLYFSWTLAIWAKVQLILLRKFLPTLRKIKTTGCILKALLGDCISKWINKTLEMGEFQCYKFRTISRSLSSEERQEVDALSSRGHVTNTSATFIYNYSDFRHRIEDVLAKYFDVALYFSNWGTKQLLFLMWMPSIR
jgi:hypothetical protein